MTAEEKTLDVPRSYRFGGVAVGRWLENQRLVQAGKKKGRLTAEQAARLDKIGMNWKKRLELAWENGCASAQRYRGSHSDLLVPCLLYTSLRMQRLPAERQPLQSAGRREL